MRVLCFGEVLWDILPQGRFLGGAPLNVAYHLAQLGCDAGLISSVGHDVLGTEALGLIAARGVAANAVGRHPAHPTGTACVQVDSAGQARFQIAEPVAWDEILIDAVLNLPAPDAIVFGTLALRTQANRIALTRLLNAFPRAWAVCDLNLRPPFDDLAPLSPLLGRTSLLKLNAGEARRLCGRGEADSDWSRISAEISARHHDAAVCITLGADGAGLRMGESWISVQAPAVTVRDTIGAGDAFTAALIAGRLLNPATTNWARILRSACSLGGFVASRDGAQPEYGRFRIEW